MSWRGKNAEPRRRAASWMTIGLISASMGLLAPGSAGAEQCPVCGDGCLPAALVEVLKQTPGQQERDCPKGCLPVERVKTLLDIPNCAYEPDARDPLESGTTNADGTRHRLGLMPTALPNPEGQLTMTGYGLGLWHIQYALNPYVEVGTLVVLPIYVAGVAPTVRFHIRLNEHLSIGAGGFFGIGGAYVNNDRGEFGLAVGGHLNLTASLGRHNLNLGLIALGYGAKGRENALSMNDEAMLLPSLGWAWSFAEDWLVLAELTAPLIVNSEGLRFREPAFLLIYGVRGHGKTIFGDVGFALPLFDDYVKEVWKYTPLGIPYFSIGVKL